MTIRVETRYQAPSNDGVPAFALQVTCMINSYMIWIGSTREENTERAVEAGKLAADWACAMPPVAVRIHHSSYFYSLA